MGLFNWKKEKEQSAPALSLGTLNVKQLAQLDAFRDFHKHSCGMTTHYIMLSNNEVKGQRIFVKCDTCGASMEITTENTPPTKLI